MFCQLFKNLVHLSLFQTTSFSDSNISVVLVKKKKKKKVPHVSNAKVLSSTTHSPKITHRIWPQTRLQVHQGLRVLGVSTDCDFP